MAVDVDSLLVAQPPEETPNSSTKTEGDDHVVPVTSERVETGDFQFDQLRVEAGDEAGDLFLVLRALVHTYLRKITQITGKCHERERDRERERERERRERRETRERREREIERETGAARSRA